MTGLVSADLPMANPKSDPDYSVFMTKYFFSSNFTYPVRCFRVSPGVAYPRLKATGLDSKEMNPTLGML
jgi:hypothetical protein